jgi:hypothetical protein
MAFKRLSDKFTWQIASGLFAGSYRAVFAKYAYYGLIAVFPAGCRSVFGLHFSL